MEIGPKDPWTMQSPERLQRGDKSIIFVLRQTDWLSVIAS